MEYINAVVSCVKVEENLPDAQETTGKGRRRKKGDVPQQYRVVFNSGMEVLFSADEVYEYNFYEEAELRSPFDTLMTRILSRRMLSAVLPFVVFTKRTAHQVKQRVSQGQYGEEPLWEQYRDAALEQLMDYLMSQQYIDDSRYTESYVRSKKDKLISARGLQMELRKRGISQELAEEAIKEAEIDEVANARALLQKKVGKNHGLPPSLSQKERGKLYRFLCSKGFSSETVRRVMGDYETDECGEFTDEYI